MITSSTSISDAPPKTYVVLNPVAGRTDAASLREKIERRLKDQKIHYHIHQTSKSEKLRKVVRATLDQGFQLYLAIGGDGTVSGVADGLVHTTIQQELSTPWHASWIFHYRLRKRLTFPSGKIRSK